MTPALRYALLACAQMLPATLVVPAIRPWFAAHHGGAEGAMHAFMSVNMFAAAAVSPWLARALRRWPRGALIRTAAIADAVLLASFALPLATNVLLVLRALEGIAHVTVLVGLLTAASEQTRRDPRAIAAAGAGLVVAIAFGSLLGTAALGLGAAAPFLVGAALAAGVAMVAPAHAAFAAPAAPRSRAPLRPLLAPVAAAFVSRFAVGSLVVTFALLAHRAHALDDRAIGLCFSSLTVPFALAVYPLMALARRWSPRAITSAGIAGYAAMLVALAWAPTAWLVPVMLLGGLASAAVFGGVLVEAAAMTGGVRAHAMALVNGAGCLGMVLGPTVAGIVSAIVGRGDPDGYRAALVIAAVPAVAWLGGTLAARGRAVLPEHRRAATPEQPPRDVAAGAVAQ